MADKFKAVFKSQGAVFDFNLGDFKPEPPPLRPMKKGDKLIVDGGKYVYDWQGNLISKKV